MTVGEKLRAGLFQQEIASYPALALDLSIDHLIHQPAEIIIAEMGTRPLKPTGDVVTNPNSPNLFQVRFQRIDSYVPLRFQLSHRERRQSTQPHIRGHQRLSGNSPLQYHVQSSTVHE